MSTFEGITNRILQYIRKLRSVNIDLCGTADFIPFLLVFKMNINHKSQSIR